MTNFRIRPGTPLAGRISVPGDKSISHRTVLLGSIARGMTRIDGLLLGEDVQRTIDAFRACGVDIEKNGSSVVIEGKGLCGLREPDSAIYCGNSGTSLRLLTGLFSGQQFPVQFTGDESLSARPMLRVVEPLRLMGASIELSESDTPPVTITPVSELKPIEWTLPVASAQVKSAILLAGLYSRLQTHVIEPKFTRNHTENLLRKFGCPVESRNGKISVKGGVELKGQQLRVPADFSSAAFFIVAALLIPHSDITLTGVGINPTRIGLLEVLESMGALFEFSNHQTVEMEPVADLRVRSVDRLKGVDVSPEVIPRMIDEIPILAIAAANAQGRTVLSGCEELRVKESDRIHSIARGLEQLGVTVEEQPAGMIIEGGTMDGGVVNSLGDHRIAMAFAVAGAVAAAEVQVQNCQCIDTSFPGFSNLARNAGMNIVVESGD